MLRRKDLPSCSHFHLQRLPFLILTCRSFFLYFFFFFIPSKGQIRSWQKTNQGQGRINILKKICALVLWALAHLYEGNPPDRQNTKVNTLFLFCPLRGKKEGTLRYRGVQSSLQKFVSGNGSNRSLCTEFPLGLSSSCPRAGLQIHCLLVTSSS